MVFRFKGVYTLQLIREHSFGYKIFTLDFELKISGNTINPKRFDFRFMNLRFFDFLPHFGTCFCSNSCSQKKKCVVQDNFTHLSFPESFALSQLVVFEL